MLEFDEQSENTIRTKLFKSNGIFTTDSIFWCFIAITIGERNSCVWTNAKIYAISPNENNESNMQSRTHRHWKREYE